MIDKIPANYVIPLLTITMGVLVVIGTVYILRSILHSAQIWRLDQEQRLLSYVENKFDVKWPVYFILSFLLGIVISWLGGNWLLVKLNIVFIFLFLFLLWGNINTLKLRKNILKRISGKSNSTLLQ